MTTADCGYPRLESEAQERVGALRGRILTKFLVHIVEPEFNVAILVTRAPRATTPAPIPLGASPSRPSPLP